MEQFPTIATCQLWYVLIKIVFKALFRFVWRHDFTTLYYTTVCSVPLIWLDKWHSMSAGIQCNSTGTFQCYVCITPLVCLLHKIPILPIVLYIETITTLIMGCQSLYVLAWQHAMLSCGFFGNYIHWWSKNKQNS